MKLKISYYYSRRYLTLVSFVLKELPSVKSLCPIRKKKSMCHFGANLLLVFNITISRVGDGFGEGL